MLYDEFLESDFAQRIIERAATVAGTALAIFRTTDAEEKHSGCGTCADACAYVNNMPWGAQACKCSRETAVTSAYTRQKPVPFLCHMGFSCTAMPVFPESDAELAMVLGPFCPTEAPDSLEQDAREGLANLTNKQIEMLPFHLTDIPLAPAETVPEVAQWLAESLQTAIELHEGRTDTHPPPATINRAASPGRPVVHPSTAPFNASTIVAALKAGDSREARLLTESQIRDTESKRRTRMSVKRARAVAVVAAVLEWAENSDTDTEASWTKFTPFQATVHELDTESDIIREAMKVLAPIARKARKPKPKLEATTKSDYDFAPLNKLMTSNLQDGITLKEAAAELGENATTITKRLQRNFGLSYSDYLGRMRVAKAKTLLRNKKLTVTQVAKRIGLNDNANFAKLFRKHEGITPTAYRKQFGDK